MHNVVTSTSERQPSGLTTKRNFEDTFEMLFERDYQAFAADKMMQEIAKKTVADSASGRQILVTFELLFQ